MLRAMNDDTIRLVPTKSDVDLAAELKQEIIEAYKPALAVLEKASKAGFIVQVGCGMDCFGQMVINELIISKRLKARKYNTNEEN